MRSPIEYLRLLVACGAVLGMLAGCASYPPNSETEIIPDKGYRFNELASNDNTESLFVVLTLSGGGTRAGALSYGVLEKLHKTQITWKGVQKSLLSEVDVISSVSGGSFTAAYYGLNRDGIFAPRSDPKSFKNRFLYRNLESELLWSLANPINWVRLASPTFGRIDLAAEIYDETIFDQKSFNDLAEKGRPFMLINATDMSRGIVFPFVQERFDYLCSNLDGFRIGRAVAASSNFPVAFTPLTINNYAHACTYEKPTWLRVAEMDGAFWDNPRRFHKARVTWSYRNFKDHPFVHLIDGGVADNIGLRGPLTALESNDAPWSLPNKINNGKIEKIVVVIVDAKSHPTVKFDRKASPPGLFTVIKNIATVPLDNYSFDTVERLNKLFRTWRQDRVHLWKNPRRGFEYCPPNPDSRRKYDLEPIDLYPIYVGFDQIRDPDERRKFFDMATSFHLPPTQVDALINIGPKLMDQSEAFNALTRCLN